MNDRERAGIIFQGLGRLASGLVAGGAIAGAEAATRFVCAWGDGLGTVVRLDDFDHAGHSLGGRARAFNNIHLPALSNVKIMRIDDITMQRFICSVLVPVVGEESGGTNHFE